VIELKAGPADRDAMGQILSYIGDLIEASTRVCGIVVAREFSSWAIAAARVGCRSVTFQLAEVAVTKQMLQDMFQSRYDDRCQEADPRRNRSPRNCSSHGGGG